MYFFASDTQQQLIEERLSEEEEEEGGIDVDFFKQKNKLRIYCIDRSDDKKHDTLTTLKSIRKEATQGMKPHFRFAGRTITDTETQQGMKLGIILEKDGHDHFDEFDCSQMCYYDISKIEKTKRPEWIKDLLKNHHHVIYASEPNKAVAFETTLLDNDEDEDEEG